MKDQMENSVQPCLALGFVATQARLALGFVATQAKIESLQLISLKFDQLLYAVLNAYTLILYHHAGDTEMLVYKKNQ